MSGAPAGAVAPPPFDTVCAVVADAAGRVLLVRKRGSRWFIQPGGKREPGEAALQTLARELREELGVALRPGSARRLGVFEHDAVNEPGRRVRAEAYAVAVDGVPGAGAEIDEIAWVDPADPTADGTRAVAPLSATRVLPAWRAAEATAGAVTDGAPPAR